MGANEEHIWCKDEALCACVSGGGGTPRMGGTAIDDVASTQNWVYSMFLSAADMQR